MDIWNYFSVSHADLRILNPSSDAKLDELIELLAIDAEARLLTHLTDPSIDLDALDRAQVLDEPVTGWVTERLLHDGRWQLAPEVFVRQLAELAAPPTSNLLIPGRQLRTMNSALRDVAAERERLDAVTIHLAPSDAEAIAAGDVPIFLGGDHSIALGTVAAASEKDQIGVLWIDAHGDFNTPETSPSGNIHGMPLAALTGTGVPEMVDLGRPGTKVAAQNVMLIGIRDLDPQERVALRGSGAGVYTMREIDDRGIGPVAREALSRLSHLSRVHVSLDMDALDPGEAPGVGTPVSGGLSYREAHLLMEIISETVTVGSIDVVEINPILDHSNRTAELATELLLSALGKTII